MSLATSRISLSPLLALAAAAALTLRAAEPLPLPQWDGGVDLPGEGFSNLLPPPPDAAPELVPPLAEAELSPQDVARFFPGGSWSTIPQQDPMPSPTPAMALKEVPAEVLASAQSAPATDSLIDPQSVVPEVVRQDLKRLLDFHRSEARVSVVVLVLNRHQKLPDRAVLDKLASGALTRRDACLAVYPYGEPWRTRFFFSRSVQDSLPTVQAPSLSSLAEDCVRDAQQATEPGEQLQRFTIRLSTRLLALEKLLRAPVVQRVERPLQEISPQLEAAASTANVGFGWAWKPALLALGLLVLGGGGGFGLHFWWGSRRRQEARAYVWLLPDFDVPPRLGGNFSGGTSAIVHYGPTRFSSGQQ